MVTSNSLFDTFGCQPGPGLQNLPLDPVVDVTVPLLDSNHLLEKVILRLPALVRESLPCHDLVMLDEVIRQGVILSRLGQGRWQY